MIANVIAFVFLGVFLATAAWIIVMDLLRESREHESFRTEMQHRKIARLERELGMDDASDDGRRP